jgi:hypothetical protein
MPIDIFGFSIGRKRTPSPNIDPSLGVKEVKSFVPPLLDDASYVDAGGYFGTYLDLDGALKTEAEFISKYREMSLHPEVESAVEDVCNEAIIVNDERKPVELILDQLDVPDSIKKKMYDEYDQVLRLLDFENRGYEIFRRWFIDGKGYYHIIIDKTNPKKGIVELRPIDSLKIKKMVEVEKETDDKTGVTFVKSVKEYYTYRERPTDQTGLKLSPEAICYYHSGLFDSVSQRAISYLHKAIKPLNQLRMIEDAVVIYRISRAPERRIFYIDVGSLPKNKAEAYVRDLMNRYRNKLTYDATTGEVMDQKNHMSMLEDYWLPRREGGKGTQIETLDGGQNLGEMDDVEYFLKKLYTALSIPKSRMEAENGFNMGRSSEITRDELKFHKYVQRLRSKFSTIFIQLLKTQCILKGILKEDDWFKVEQNLKFEYITDSYFTELKEYEILSERLDILTNVQEHIGDYYSREWVRRNILQQTEKDIKRQDKQIQKERELGLIKDDSGGF